MTFVRPQRGCTNVHDRHGDLIVLIGPPGYQQYSFQVCSRTMARSSRAWDTMLYHPLTKESLKPADGSDWVIQWEESTDHDAFHLIMCAIHHKRLIWPHPEYLQTDGVISLMEFVDFWDLDHLVPFDFKRYVSIWLCRQEHYFGVDRMDARLLYLAFFMGHQQCIERWIEWQINRSSDDQPAENEDPEMDAVIRKLCDMFNFDLVLDRIQEIRDQKMQDLCAIWSPYFDGSLGTRHRGPGRLRGNDLCRRAVRNSITDQEAQHNIVYEHWFEDPQWDSPIACYEAMMQIELSSDPGCMGAKHYCNPTGGNRRLLRSTMWRQEEKTVLTEEMIRMLAARKVY